jgi:1-acyl-sn-glycerol-3-phosphate acyltransferase
MVMVQNRLEKRLSLERPGGRLMPYKHGRPVIDLSFWFRTASAWTYALIIPIAFLINFLQHFTTFKHRWRITKVRRAVTVSNHTTFFDPVTVSALTIPHLMFQTLLEATVEFPFLGTFTRLLGGVPIPRGKTSYRKIAEIGEKAFKYRRFLHFYPEGECFLYNQHIRKFHTGAFRIAAELDVPVLPLVTVFSNGLFKPWSFWGRSLPLEKLIVLEPVYPSQYVQRDGNGEITMESVREFAEAVRQKMQAEIDSRKGSAAFFRGQMERIKGLND